MFPALMSKKEINPFEVDRDRAFADSVEASYLNRYHFGRWTNRILDPWVRLYRSLYDLGWRPDSKEDHN